MTIDELIKQTEESIRGAEANLDYAQFEIDHYERSICSDKQYLAKLKAQKEQETRNGS